MYGPCLSAIGGGQALTSPSRHRLGRPLPYQQADKPQTNPIPESIARNLYLTRSEDYRELANLSAGYARAWGMYLRVTNPSATARPKPGRLTCMPYPRR